MTLLLEAVDPFAGVMGSHRGVPAGQEALVRELSNRSPDQHHFEAPRYFAVTSNEEYLRDDRIPGVDTTRYITEAALVSNVDEIHVLVDKLARDTSAVLRIIAAKPLAIYRLRSIYLELEPDDLQRPGDDIRHDYLSPLHNPTAGVIPQDMWMVTFEDGKYMRSVEGEVPHASRDFELFGCMHESRYEPNIQLSVHKAMADNPGQGAQLHRVKSITLDAVAVEA